MRKIREILRLKHEQGLSHRAISPGVLHRRRHDHAVPAADGPARDRLAVAGRGRRRRTRGPTARTSTASASATASPCNSSGEEYAQIHPLPAVGPAAATVDAAGPPGRREEDVHRLLGQAADAGRPPDRRSAACRAVRRRARRQRPHCRRGAVACSGCGSGAEFWRRFTRVIGFRWTARRPSRAARRAAQVAGLVRSTSARTLAGAEGPRDWRGPTGWTAGGGRGATRSRPPARSCARRRAPTCRSGSAAGRRRGRGRLRSGRFRNRGSESGRGSRGGTGLSSFPASVCSCSGSSRPGKRNPVRCRRRRIRGTGAGFRTGATART